MQTECAIDFIFHRSNQHLVRSASISIELKSYIVSKPDQFF